VVTAGGQRTVIAALTPRAYCDPCSGHIAECLDELPSAYGRLEAELGESSRRGQAVHVPFGPRLPLRENVDALMRRMAAILCAWEARVRATARLVPRDAAQPVDSPRSVSAAVETLSLNLGVLLALQPGWMTTTLPLELGRHGRPAVISAKTEDTYGDAEIVRLGVDCITVMTRLDGEAAGADILRLHYRCLAILGEVSGHADTLDGVPCRRCEDMALERAEPPSDPKLAVMWSVCASCRDQMDREDFTAWAAMYSRWADDSGLVCKRCQGKRCDECVYPACACTGTHPLRRVLSGAQL
jgi:hypothetical protein